MSHTSNFFLLVVLFTFSFSQFQPSLSPEFCLRRMNLDASINAKTVVTTLFASCNEKTSKVNASLITMAWTSGNGTLYDGNRPSYTPIYSISSSFKPFPQDSQVVGTSHHSYIAATQYIFYRDSDSQVGYQPEKDTVVLSTLLNDSRTVTNKFDSFIKNSVDLENGHFYHRFSLQLLKEFSTNQIVTTSEITSKDIQYQNFTNLERLAFAPNSIRFTTRIEGVSNFPASANGVALSLVILTEKDSSFNQKGLTIQPSFSYPHYTLQNQDSFAISAPKLPNATFFSFRKSIPITPTGKSTFYANVYSAGPYALGPVSDIGLPTRGSNYTFWRFWLSVPETIAKTDNFNFEYSYGINEIPINGARPLTISILLIFIYFIMF